MPAWATIDANTGILSTASHVAVGNQTFQFYIESGSTSFKTTKQKLVTFEVEAPKCNDGEITSNEQCEDGNTVSGDGCSDTCQVEDGWTWVNNPTLTSSTCSPIWGDGKLVGTEKCDDGNTKDNQGCLSDWTGTINGWHCSGGTPTQPDSWVEKWNDGYITQSEECEDGNTVSGDGCSDTCKVEPEWNCKNNAAMTSTTCTPKCGDGIIVGNETCDHGNNTTFEGCNDTCTGVKKGWYCTETSSLPAFKWKANLTDGFRLEGHEEWDDGNQVDVGDGCTNSRTVEEGWTCQEDSNHKSNWQYTFQTIQEAGEAAVVVAGTSVASSVAASSFSPTSSQTVWSLLNSLQMVLVLMAMKIYIPQAIRNYIASFQMFLLDFKFLSLQSVPGVYIPAKELEADGPSEMQSNAGFESKSAAVNIYSTFLVLLFVILIHLFIYIFMRIWKAKWNWRLVSWIEKLLESIKYKFYLRWIMEVFILLWLASLTELRVFTVSTTVNWISIIISFLILVFCIAVITAALYFSFCNTEKEYKVFNEFYWDYKSDWRSKCYRFVNLYRRMLIIIWVVFLSDSNRTVCFIIIFAITLLYLVFLFCHPPIWEVHRYFGRRHQPSVLPCPCYPHLGIWDSRRVEWCQSQGICMDTCKQYFYIVGD